jgi:hypothetical protein
VEWRDAVSEGRLVTTTAGASAAALGEGSTGSWGQGRLITTVDNPRLLALVRDSVARLPLTDPNS